MSESNPNISLPSQGSGSDDASGNANKQELTTLVNESEKSENVKPSASKIAKPTGLKLAGTAMTSPSTRIGRLCNNVPKPSIPPNPGLTERSLASRGEGGGGGGGGGGKETMSTSSLRRVGDELARRRLADVDESDENSISFYGNGSRGHDRKMSSGSVLSDSSRKSDEVRGKRFSDASSPADFYSWKSDERPRRASDASVVLTEDTDQFIIGDRVWVGGVKPGQIAYIGETQFAPGEWAGIVLDEPIGKNDGTVANIRYFQCEPRKGIFSRLTRLTRYPLVEGGAGEPAASRPVPAESRKSNGSLFASMPKKASLVLTSPTPSKNSTPKPPSPDSSLHPNVQVGDRVIVKSSRGSKAGVLRYLGSTDFAAGEWCGVELDDPLGKNDGSVSGTRYFECRPNFGLFAPLHKVSKSPANKRPSQGNCAIHSRSGPPPGPAGIRRQGSKESLVSLSSTASTAASVRSTSRKIGVRTPTTPTSAKNALQETLKEKELHIEQLLKERDLERAEVTRAASQADEAERRLVALKQEFEQLKEEAEARVSDLDAMVCLLRAENEELKNLLDDEKKKLEDLQFRFEEETIDKADMKSMSMKYEDKIKMMEKALCEERKRAEALEQDSNKLFEAEEQMVILKDELDSAKEEVSRLTKMQTALEQEHISLEAHLTSARAEIKSLKIENESFKSSSSQEHIKLRENHEKVLRAYEECRGELERKQKEAEKVAEELLARENSFSEKEKELHAKYLKIISELTEKHKAETGSLSTLLQDSKTNSEVKLKLLENELEEKLMSCGSLEAQVHELNVLLSKTAAERSFEKKEEMIVQERLQSELKRAEEEVVLTKEKLVRESGEKEKLLREKQSLEEEVAGARRALAHANKSADQQVVSLKGLLEKQAQELKEMKSEVEGKSQKCKLLEEELASRRKGEEERFREMEKLIGDKNSEVERLREECESNRRETKRLLEALEESFKAKVKNLEVGEAERQKESEALSRELESVRTSLAEKESELRDERCNSKNLAEKLALEEKNRKKMGKEKDEIELEARETTRKVEFLEEKLAQATSQKAKLESDISNFINTSNDSSLQLAKLNEDLRTKEKEMDALREDFTDKIRSLERVEQTLKQSLEKQEAEAKASREELEKVSQIHQKEVEILKNKLEAGVLGLNTAELEWKERLEELKKESDAAVSSLEEKVKEMQKKEEEERKEHEEGVRKLVRTQEELTAKLKETEAAAVAREKSLEKKIEEMDVERRSLIKFAEEAQAEYVNSGNQMAEKMKKDAESLAAESEKLRSELRETTGKLAMTAEELAKEKEEKNRLNDEKWRLEKTTGVMEELVKELQMKTRELEMKANSVESENKVLKDAINQMREEKSYLDRDGTEKMLQLTELRSQLEALEFAKKTREAIDDVRIRNLEEEASELKAKYQRAEATHSAEVAEKTKRAAELKDEVERLERKSKEEMTQREKDVEKMAEVASQLRKELEDCKFEAEKRSEEMNKLEKKFQQVKGELESEKKRSEEYGKRLNASEAERIDLKERFEEQSKLLADSADLGGKLSEVREKLSETERKGQEASSNAKLEKEALEKMLETTSSLLSQRESEAEALKREKSDLFRSNQALMEALQKQNADLQKQLEGSKQSPAKAPTTSDAEGGCHRELLEEREFQKGQVDFLNSVIVDMQKKNDALKARIEILEMGFAPEDVDEFNLHNITTRSVAPRLFCDICDRFDLHDTEDCPTQANEDMPALKSSKAKVSPPERPYCEICEVFGHDTADCDDGETF